jgi:hypothetical protein
MSEQKYSNTTISQNNVPSKGMMTDLADSFLPEGVWTRALNAVNNSHKGDIGILGNEPSNELVGSAPYDILSVIQKSVDELVIFSTDDLDSEIGVFNKNKKTYTTVINDRGLNFNQAFTITGVTKSNYDCTTSVYFRDSKNPDRCLNLDRVPYRPTGNNLSLDPTCFVAELSTDLDTDAIRLHPPVNIPIVKTKKGQGSGQLINGSYQAAIAYSENGIRLTDYTIPSNAQPVWLHEGLGGSLEVILEDLDESFEEYELVVISTVNMQTVAKKIGNYSIRQNTVYIDQILAALPTVNLSEIPLRSNIYEKSDGMFNVGPYLLRKGLLSQKLFNYQPQANKIRTRWNVAEYPADYYRQGGNKAGYMRDEVYSFFIRWVYKTGGRTASFHIPGRSSKLTDKLETTDSNVMDVSQNERWQVYDTSSMSGASGLTNDGGKLVYKGDMAYWESTEKYPDNNPGVWGELCGKPIRHHKFPSNENIHIHSQGGEFIYVMGVEFDRIEHPLDENGFPIEDIVGYEILRGSREGNRSIVAKGLFNNMWEYALEGQNGSKKGYYQNYPYNDLNPDQFLVKFRSSLEKGTPSVSKMQNEPSIDSYKKDFFSFHSPDTSFVRPFVGGNHIKIYTEQQATVNGSYSTVYKHPKYVVLTDLALGTGIAVGLGMAFIATLGQASTDTTLEPSVFGIKVGSVSVQRTSGLGSIFGDIGANAVNVPGLAGTVTGVALLVAQSAYFVGQSTAQVLNIIRSLSKERDFVLQYNSHGFYGDYSSVNTPEKTFIRNIPASKISYVGRGIQDFDTFKRVNNLNRNKFLAIQTDQEIPNPSSVIENTRQTVRFASGINHENPFGSFTTKSVSYYGAVKVSYDNQYGQLERVIQIPVESKIHKTLPKKITTFGTGPLFGGDVYINRYTEKNPFYFFNNWLTDVPNGTEIDYRKYVNGPTPRFWADFNKFDIDDFKIEINLKKGSRGMKKELQKLGQEEDPGRSKKIIEMGNPSDFHRFDRASNIGGIRFSVKNCWMYLFMNGVRDFFAESEMNLALRDYGDEDKDKFFDPYGEVLSDLNVLFRSDLITKPIFHKYDFSLSASKLYNNFSSWGSILPSDFDPLRSGACFEYLPKRVIYSLPHREGLKRDNWRNFLGANFKDFSGQINNIKSLNETGAVILFENREPVQFVGQDTFQSGAGVKFTIGDAGLFQQAMQSMVNADNEQDYGSSQSLKSAVNTPFGLFWVSQRSGKIFRLAGGSPEDITRLGKKYWFGQYLPSKLLAVYPEYPLADNAVKGIACQTVYDTQYEMVYFIKKDFVPLRSDLMFDSEGNFYHNDHGVRMNVSLEDTAFFKPAHWTVSFDPKQNTWISYHSWIPDIVVGSNDHFLTVKKNELWKHNHRTDSFCNFYGKDYPFEIESVINTPGAVTTLRSVEYVLEALKFYDDGKNFEHVLDENFDIAVIYNSEQVSGYLKLNLKAKNNPVSLLQFPKINAGSIDILFSKEENKFRFNQFWDILKNRGEFTPGDSQIWELSANGVDRILNTTALDYNKSPLERKKFRHFGNKLLLVKSVSGDKKLIVKLINTKHLFSSR